MNKYNRIPHKMLVLQLTSMIHMHQLIADGLILAAWCYILVMPKPNERKNQYKWSSTHWMIDCTQYATTETAASAVAARIMYYKDLRLDITFYKCIIISTIFKLPFSRDHKQWHRAHANADNTINWRQYAEFCFFFLLCGPIFFLLL